MTAAQERVLAAVERLSEECGFPPTVREIQVELGYGSVSTVHVHLAGLRAVGQVNWSYGCARTLRVV